MIQIKDKFNNLIDYDNADAILNQKIAESKKTLPEILK